MIDLAAEVADPGLYGWKAHYLSLLVEHGFVVPAALALAPDEEVDATAFRTDVPYAVRSSGLIEDSQTSSYAGHFRTHLSVLGTDDVLSAIDAVRKSGAGEMPMAVVVQEMVDEPLISGVAFSCHPVTTDSTIAVVSWVDGLADGLVSGVRSGNDLDVRLLDGEVLEGDWPLEGKSLTEITDGLLHLQRLLGQPVDVEWCIDGSGTLVLLQVRPVVFPVPAVEQLDSVDSFGHLPAVVASHSKLSLRADAARLGVPMSRARAILATQFGGLPALAQFPASEDSAGRSVVLLHPTHIGGRIVREFTKDCSADVEFFVRGCQRYAIRQYPDQAGAADSIDHTLGIGLEHSAMACVIEQEILHAYATGILRRTVDGYLVEVALGHFVPKGFVETSTYALSEGLEIILRSEVPQTKAYHFVNGHVVVESPPYEPLDLTDADLQRLVRAMQPILDRRPGVALEFGLLAHRRDELEPYMIDIADGDKDVAALSTLDATRGVVSAGTASGRVVDLRVAGATDDFNAHLYDTVHCGNASLDPTVYVARRASLDLLPIVRSAAPGSGFVFERASLLAHLAVVLRERGLAGVTQPQEKIQRLLAQADWLTINTANRDMVRAEEVTER